MELHQRGEVGKTHVVSTRGHAGDRAARAVAGIHRHIQPGSLEVTLGHRRQKQGAGAFKAPVQLELDRRGLRLRLPKQRSSCQNQGSVEKSAFVHVGLVK